MASPYGCGESSKKGSLHGVIEKLQLGIFLRHSLSAKKIQFERNVSYFGMKKTAFVKRKLTSQFLTAQSRD